VAGHERVGPQAVGQGDHRVEPTSPLQSTHGFGVVPAR
jgi:hypothetical protein